MARGRRHWKQRWDPDADFVFLKRLKLGLKGMMNVMPGDDVPKDNPRIAKKLRKWWNAEVIGIKGFELKKTGSNRPIHPNDMEAFRLRALEELQAIEPDATAALGAYLGGSLYGLLVSGGDISAFYMATIPMWLPPEVKLPWEQVPEESLPVAILDTFDLPPEKPKEEPTEPTPEEAAALLERVEALGELGYTFLVGNGPGVRLMKDDEEVGVFPSIEDALERASEPASEEPPVAPEGPAEGEEPGESSEPTVEKLGGGWFAVLVPGEDEPRRVHGKAALEAILEELRATAE